MNTEALKKIIEDIETGKSYHVMKMTPKYNLKPYKIHIREIVDGRMVVFRWWSLKRKNWVYQIDDPWVVASEIYNCKEKMKEEGEKVNA